MTTFRSLEGVRRREVNIGKSVGRSTALIMEPLLYLMDNCCEQPNYTNYEWTADWLASRLPLISHRT